MLEKEEFIEEIVKTLLSSEDYKKYIKIRLLDLKLNENSDISIEKVVISCFTELISFLEIKEYDHKLMNGLKDKIILRWEEEYKNLIKDKISSLEKKLKDL